MRSHKNLNQPHLLAVTKREVLCLFHCSIFLTLLALTCSVGCGLLVHIWSSWKKRPDSLLSSAPGTCSQYTSCAGPGFHLILLGAYWTSQNSRKDSVGLHLTQLMQRKSQGDYTAKKWYWLQLPPPPLFFSLRSLLHNRFSCKMMFLLKGVFSRCVFPALLLLHPMHQCSLWSDEG